MAKHTKVVYIRVPGNLHSRLLRLAKEKRWTVNTFVVVVLEEYLKGWADNLKGSG